MMQVLYILPVTHPTEFSETSIISVNVLLNVFGELKSTVSTGGQFQYLRLFHL